MTTALLARRVESVCDFAIAVLGISLPATAISLFALCPNLEFGVQQSCFGVALFDNAATAVQNSVVAGVQAFAWVSSNFDGWLEIVFIGMFLFSCGVKVWLVLTEQMRIWRLLYSVPALTIACIVVLVLVAR